MGTTENEQKVIEILSQANDLVADAQNAFYDIAGMELEKWDEIRTLIFSIKATLDIMVKSHREERFYR